MCPALLEIRTSVALPTTIASVNRRPIRRGKWADREDGEATASSAMTASYCSTLEGGEGGEGRAKPAATCLRVRPPPAWGAAAVRRKTAPLERGAGRPLAIPSDWVQSRCSSKE